MAIAFVRGAAATGASSAPAVTLSGTPTQNNLLVAQVGNNSTGTYTTANGYTLQFDLTNGDRFAASYKIAGASEGTSQAPLTISASRDWICYVAEYSGTATASVLEASTSNNDNDVTKTTTGSCDPTDGVERLLVGMAWEIVGSVTFTWGSQKFNGSTTGVTERADQRNTSKTGGTYWDKIDSSTVAGSYTAEAVCDDTGDGAVALLIFKAGATTNYKDTATRFRLALQGFKDTATRFRLRLQGYKDAASRFRLQVTNYKDTATRFRLWIQGYKDTATRFRLQATAYRDVATRFNLGTVAFKDVAARFRLSLQGFKDTATRFRLLVDAYRDAASRFRLALQGYKDAATRFRLSLPGFRDAASRFFLVVQTHRDAATRFVLGASLYRDVATRFRLQNPDFSDIITLYHAEVGVRRKEHESVVSVRGEDAYTRIISTR